MGCVNSVHSRSQAAFVPYNDVALNTEFLRLSNDCVQEFVSYYGKNTTAPELAAKILSAVDEFKKLWSLVDVKLNSKAVYTCVSRFLPVYFQMGKINLEDRSCWHIFATQTNSLNAARVYSKVRSKKQHSKCAIEQTNCRRWRLHGQLQAPLCCLLFRYIGKTFNVEKGELEWSVTSSSITWIHGSLFFGINFGISETWCHQSGRYCKEGGHRSIDKVHDQRMGRTERDFWLRFCPSSFLEAKFTIFYAPACECGEWISSCGVDGSQSCLLSPELPPQAAERSLWRFLRLSLTVSHQERVWKTERPWPI